MATVKVTAGDLKDGLIRVNNVQDAPSQSVSMPSRYVATIDSGVEVEVEDGFCLCFGVVSELAEKGVVITNSPGRVTKGKVTLNVLNGGREIVSLSHGQAVAHCWVEPHHEVDWA